MKESWESWQTGTPESERAYFRRNWESRPWLEGVTDAQGEAVIRIESTAMDSTRGNEPPAKRDVVSNREHIIKLVREDVQDEIRIVMKPGAVGAGKQYTVRIVAISSPRYVLEPPERTWGARSLAIFACGLSEYSRAKH